MSTSTDVVVTGLGATTPLGGDVQSTWDALLAGRSDPPPETPAPAPVAQQCTHGPSLENNALLALGFSAPTLITCGPLPETGGTLWSDNLLVPIASPYKKNAEKLMDFYYDPTVAATVAAYVNYICPVEGAKAEMEKIDPSLVDSPLIFPTAEDLANVKVFRTLSADEETLFSEEFQKVIGN